MARIIGWLACAGAVALLIVAMITGTAPASAEPLSRVGDVTVRLPVVPGRPAAGYFTLSAPGEAVELIRVTSPRARVEMHDTSMAGSIMRMDALTTVRVAAGQHRRFMPGGAHLMLFDVAVGVRPGATLPLTFVFGDGMAVTVDATVRAATATGR